MKKTEKAPECLVKLYEIATALEDARYMKSALQNNYNESILPETMFLEAQIKDLEWQHEKLCSEAEAIINHLRFKDNRAYLAIKFHYCLGMNWDEIAVMLKDTRDAIRHRAYRAFEKL